MIASQNEPSPEELCSLTFIGIKKLSEKEDWEIMSY